MYKKFIFIFFSIVIISIVLIGACNYSFNRYRLFDYNHEYLYGRVNERYVKMAYLIDNKEKYTGYLFGSSRVAKIDTKLLPKEVFNFGCNGCSSPDEWLRDIKIMHKNGVKIESIYLGLDDLFLKDSSERTQKFIELKHYVSGWERASYLLKVLFQKPDFHDIKMQLNRSYDKENKIDLKNGMTVVPEYVDMNIEKNPKLHINDVKFTKSYYVDDNLSRLDSAINEIMDIDLFCRNNNIELVIFFNPVHIRTDIDNDITLQNEAKRRVVKIKPFYDFSGVNFITTNNYFWYETSHPRAFVGDYMMKIIQDKEDDNVPNGFGYYVTEDNIEKHLQKKVKERMEWFKKSNYEQYVPNVNDKLVYH